MYIVHRPDRLVDIIELMRKYKIEPKKMRPCIFNNRKRTNISFNKRNKKCKTIFESRKATYCL